MGYMVLYVAEEVWENLNRFVVFWVLLVEEGGKCGCKVLIFRVEFY